MALIGTLTDDFNGTTLDAAKWTPSSQNGGAVAVGSGAALLSTTAVSNSFGGITSAVATYSVAGSAAYAKITMSTTANMLVELQLNSASAGKIIRLQCLNGAMRVYSPTSGWIALGAYNVSTWTYWRISIDGAGAVSTGRSTDGVNWTMTAAGFSVDTSATYNALIQSSNQAAVASTTWVESFNQVAGTSNISDLQDDFNGTVLDAAKWVGAASGTDTITVAGGLLSINRGLNGYPDVRSTWVKHSLTNSAVFAKVSPSTLTGVSTEMAVYNQLGQGGWLRLWHLNGSMIASVSNIAGTLFAQATIAAYDPVLWAYWKIRFAATGAAYIDRSPDGAIWTQAASLGTTDFGGSVMLLLSTGGSAAASTSTFDNLNIGLPIGTLTDDFNGTTLDAAKWTPLANLGGTVVVSGGAVNLNKAATVNSIARITSLGTYTAAGSSVFMKVAPLAVTSNLYAELTIYGGGNTVGIYSDNGTMKWYAGAASATIEAYNPATWLYWRIAVSAAGLVTVGRSVDAVTWTMTSTGVTLTPTASIRAAINSVDNGGTPNTGTVTVESFNLVPPPVLIETLQDEFNGTTLDAAKWAPATGSGGSVSVAGGLCSLVSSTTSGSYGQITAQINGPIFVWTIYGSSVYAKVGLGSMTAYGLYMNLSAANVSNAVVQLACVNGQMQYTYGASIIGTLEAYNPATWVYWKISCTTGGVLSFARSADGTTWTTFSPGVSIPLGALHYFQIYGQRSAAGATAITSTIDSINVVAAAPIVKTQTDLAGATDSATVRVTRTVTSTDLAGATDAVTVRATRATTATDRAGATDSATVAIALDTTPPTAPGTPVLSQPAPTAVTLTWSVATDNKAVTQYRIYRNGAVLDTFGAGITSYRSGTGITPGINYTFTVSALDAAGNEGPQSGAVVYNGGVPYVDLAGATDSSITRRLTRGTVTDLAGATDSATVRASRTTLRTDLAGATDSATVRAARTTVRTDLAGATDSLSIRTARTLAAADLAGATDALTWTAVRLLAVSDTAGATDTVQLTTAGNTAVNRTDLAGGTDAVALTWVRTATFTDLAGATDNATTSTAGNVMISRTDTAGASDSAVASRTAVSAYTDAAGATDQLSVAVGRSLAVTDLAGSTDATARTWLRRLTATDRAGSADNVSVLADGRYVFTERAGATDGVRLTAVTSRTVVELAGGTDTVRVSLARTVTFTDLAGGTDTVRSSSGQTVRVTDRAGASDQASISGSAARRVTDRAGASDAVSIVMERHRTVTDMAGGTDTVLINGMPAFPASFDMWLTADLGADTIMIRNAPMTTVPDKYGKRARDWAMAETTTVTRCSVQPFGATETVIDREFTNTHVRLFAPPGLPLAATSRVLFDGVTYEVDGEPGAWRDLDGRPSHIEANLKRLNG